MPGILPHGLRLIDSALQLIFQAECAACGRSHLALHDGLCRYCRIWYPLRGPICQRCGMILTQAMEACGECQRWRRPALSAARSLLWLEEATKTLLHRIKYGRRYEYLDLFRPEIAAGFVRFFPDQPLVVPVPMHPARLAWRGFNQAELLARAVARAAELPFDVDGLCKQTLTEPQASLSSVQRQNNLRGSFRWRRATQPKSILLIDDVYTTGATLQACARTLRRAGVRQVYAWTLFRTPRPQ